MTVHIYAGGDPVSPGRVATLPDADLTIAADSGAEHALAAGRQVNVLVGDLDSISPPALKQIRRSGAAIEEHPKAKDATDLALAWSVARRARPRRIVVVGGGGGRLDHLLGNLAVITSPADERTSVTWVTEAETSYVINANRRIPISRGALFSVIAVGGKATGVHVRGARWELEDASLEPDSTRGVSNIAVSDRIEVEVDRGVLLAIVPHGP